MSNYKWGKVTCQLCFHQLVFFLLLLGSLFRRWGVGVPLSISRNNENIDDRKIKEEINDHEEGCEKYKDEMTYREEGCERFLPARGFELLVESIST